MSSSADFHIELALTPLEDVSPRSWFSLTDSRHDIVVDGQPLLSPIGERGIDYYAARPWEDLIRLLPAALDPLPPAVARRLADFDAWYDFVDANFFDHEVAFDWWSAHSLDNGHLTGAPWLYAWCDGEQVHLNWRPRGDDGAGWSAPRGSALVSASTFRDAVLDFDRRLISAMDERVRMIEAGWRHPTEPVDALELRRDHEARTTELERFIRHHGPQRHHTWADIIAALPTTGS